MCMWVTPLCVFAVIFAVCRACGVSMAKTTNTAIHPLTKTTETTETTAKTVGVLGGLGPAATADFFSKLVTATPAATDQDHLHIIIDNNPKVPNRNEAVAGTGVSPAPVLAEMASRLEVAGADFLVMVCNAAHAFQDAITDAASVPFVSIIEETSDAVKAQLPTGAKVGVLASSGCLDTDLYQDALAARGLHALIPAGATKDAFMTFFTVLSRGMRTSVTICANWLKGLCHKGRKPSSRGVLKCRWCYQQVI